MDEKFEITYLQKGGTPFHCYCCVGCWLWT